MSIEVRIIDGPLPPILTDWRPTGAGAVIAFEGIVRPEEAGHAIDALDYEIYQPMAGQMLERLARQIMTDHSLDAILVEHSRGHVPAGMCSFRLRIASRHRKAAILAMEQFIDRMKQDVPIWKSSVRGAGGAA